VVTSPSGAVIRDILHRLADRFPRRVLIWPVAVQGEKAAAEVAAAIAGFNRLPEQGPVPRPDVLIVARGGGSLEDLWAFNEEIVVRAAAASTIPLISAVGHETDTTLIDFASDRRAPTPTAAAEMAVPVRADLLAEVMDYGKRSIACLNRALREARTELNGLARALGDPRQMIAERQQRLDIAGERLVLGPRRVIEVKQQQIAGEARALRAAGERFKSDARQKMERVADRVVQLGDRLKRHSDDLLQHSTRQIDQFGKLLESYSFHSVLQRGFALVRDQDGQPVLAAAGLKAGDAIGVEFGDGEVRARVTDGAAVSSKATAAAPARKKPGGPGNQGSLL
jgi:exodeoxyribonuclease VII large subunit